MKIGGREADMKRRKEIGLAFISLMTGVACLSWALDESLRYVDAKQQAIEFRIKHKLEPKDFDNELRRLERSARRQDPPLEGVSPSVYQQLRGSDKQFP